MRRAHNSRVGLSPTTNGSAYDNFPNLLFKLYLVIDLFVASSAGSVASSANKQRGGGLSNCWPTSPTPQQVQKGMHFPGRREDHGVNQIEGSQSCEF